MKITSELINPNEPYTAFQKDSFSNFLFWFKNKFGITIKYTL